MPKPPSPADPDLYDTKVKDAYLRRRLSDGGVVARVLELQDGTVVVEPLVDWLAYTGTLGSENVLPAPPPPQAPASPNPGKGNGVNKLTNP